MRFPDVLGYERQGKNFYMLQLDAKIYSGGEHIFFSPHTSTSGRSPPPVFIIITGPAQPASSRFPESSTNR